MKRRGFLLGATTLAAMPAVPVAKAAAPVLTVSPPCVAFTPPVYGRSPADIALPDVRRLNALLDRIINPPLLVSEKVAQDLQLYGSAAWHTSADGTVEHVPAGDLWAELGKRGKS